MRWRKIFIVFIYFCFCGVFANENLDILRAMDFVQTNQPEKAVEIYKKLYKQRKDKNFLKEAIAVAYESGLPEIDELLVFSKEILKNDEDSLYIFTLRYLEKKDFKNAKNCAINLIKINSNAKNHLLFAIVLANANELNEAKREYEKAYELEKTDNYLLALAQFLDIRLGNKDEAIRLLESSKRINGCSEAVCLTLAEIYIQERKFDELTLIYDGLYDLTKDNIYLDKQMGILLGLKKFSNAIAVIKKYKYKEDELPQIYAANGDFDEAIKAADEFYESTKNADFKSKAAIYRYEKFGSKINKNELEKVVSDFEISAIQTDNALYLNYYGYLLIDHDLNVQKGIDLVNIALKKEPNSPFYLDSLAWGYYKLNKCKIADEMMQKAMQDSEFAGSNEAKEHQEKIKKCLSEQR